MLRKVGLVSTLLLALPAFAHAWTVTAKIGSGQGSVVSGTKTISLPVAAPATGSIGYYKVANLPLVADQTFTVTPAPGYSVSSVIVNGAPATANADGTFTIAAGSPIKNNQSLVAYFKQNLLTLTATQPDPLQGRIILQACDVNGNTYGARSMTSISGLKSTGYVKVTAYPNADYKVATVGGVAAAGLQGDVVSAVVPATAGSATATFDLVSLAKPVVSLPKTNALPSEVIAVDATKTVANKPIAKYTFSATKADGTAAANFYFNPKPVKVGYAYVYNLAASAYVPDATGKATVLFQEAGDYRIKVTVTFADNTEYSADSVPVHVAADNSCTTCHNNRNADLMAAVQSGKHAYGIAIGHDTDACQRCHTTEGYNNFSAQTSAFGAAAPTWTTIANADAAGNFKLTSVGCYACHNNHDAVLRTTPAGWDPKYSATGASASTQFKLCTSCHNVVGNDGTPIASGLTVSGTVTTAKQQHAKDWYRNIASTHYDLPTTGVALTTTYIEGYNIRWNKSSACTDCHGHDFNVETGASKAEAPSIQTQWAKSGHAGKLLTQKWNVASPGGVDLAKNTANAALIMAAGVTGDTGAAWEHYNWDAVDRQDCQKCHTSTGVSNYLNAVNTYNNGGALTVAYDKTKNDFSHLVGWTSTTASNQNEMLYCWGCHSDAGTGALRASGKMVLDYKAATTDTKNIELTVAGKGAVCVSCHAGRGNVTTLLGASLVDPTAALSGTTTPKNSGSATATHYLNAGATIFQADTKVGYQFPGLNYANPVYYKHNTVGCNDCHMPAKNHEFEVAAKDTNGVITQVLATNCATCHLVGTQYEMTAAKLEEEAAGYNQALSAFNAALVAQGYTWTSAYPYFLFTSTDLTVKALKWRKQGDIGAGHNFNYLKHEPGAYAHNRVYAKRLIFDSIDWLDNNVINGAITIDATAYPEAAVWFGAPAGTTGSYTASRP